MKVFYTLLEDLTVSSQWIRGPPTCNPSHPTIHLSHYMTRAYFK
jgi:hypothetical protein